MEKKKEKTGDEIYLVNTRVNDTGENQNGCPSDGSLRVLSRAVRSISAHMRINEILN